MKNTPKVTIALLCYNQQNHIQKSIASCLEQDYTNLTVVISDDASQDDTYNIIKKFISDYKGSHKIVINQNIKNLGIGKHFSFVMENLVEGDLVVMSAGDDISKPTRVSRIVDEWIKNNKPSLVAHSLEEIDENDNVFLDNRTFQYEHQDNSIHSNQLYSMLEYHKFYYPIHYLGAAVAYRIDTYMEFGSPVTYPDCEDHLMYFRSLLAKGVHYFPEILVRYRKHGNSYTSQEIKPFNDSPSSYLSYLLNKDNGLHEKYINCYASHKIIVQQWIDYVHKLKKDEIKVDFQLVESIWYNMLRRHKYLIKNKGLKSNLTIFSNKLKNLSKPKRYIARTYEMNYVTPLKTVIFGTAAGAKNTLTKIGPGFDIILACNTDPTLKGKHFAGLEIINLEQLDEIIDDIDCVLIASSLFFKIKQILLENTKINKNKIVRVPMSVILN